MGPPPAPAPAPPPSRPWALPKPRDMEGEDTEGLCSCNSRGWVLTPVTLEAPGDTGDPSPSMAPTPSGSAASQTLWADRIRGLESVAMTAIKANWLRSWDTVDSRVRMWARRPVTSSFLAASWLRRLKT
jgi:hypothetical protein